MNSSCQDNKNKHKYLFGSSLLCLVFFVLDRILKYLALSGRIAYQKNSGIAFSINMPSDLFLYFYILVFLILFFLIWQLVKSIYNNYGLPITPKSFASGQAGYWLLILGAASNLIDRLKFGFIVDYLNFGFFSNNLADLMVCLGVVLVVLHLISQKSWNGV